MKKGVIFIFAILFFLSAFPFIASQVNDTQINNGFSCLNAKIASCSSLSIGERIFSSLATGQCTSQIESSEAGNGCFPSGSCDTKTTSQAILALKNSGRSTDKSAAWLLSQKKSTSDINWYLQIDSNSNTSCTVSYSGTSYTVEINQDKKINNGAGTCLAVSQSGYWLLVSPSCYGTNLSVSCNQPFTTTELYERQGYPTIYVSSSSNSATAGGTVKNSVDSSCFGGTSCNYEASLWASAALDSVGKDVSSFIPYLTVMADDTQNQQYLPYSFLYSLTSSSDFLDKLLSRQKTVNNQNYWDEGSAYGQYYDTALALLPLQSQTSSQKTSAVDWLLASQGSDGCWNSGNILDTAFILYSIAGSRATSPTSTASCTSSGYYCMSSSSCTQSGGSVLQGYTCSSSYSCCSQQLTIPTCSSQGGIICSSGQICQGGSQVTASDTSSSQICCLSGSCTTQQTTKSACELAGGACRNSCLSNEQSLAQSCSLGSQSCCAQKSQGTGTVWIWILGILIFFIILGIIFRKKLRVLWFRIKSGGGPAQQPPRTSPPPFRPQQPPMSFQRRFPVPQQRPRQKPTEVNDVLKRLKEIGK
jgi:hypothetical protein